MVGRSSRRRTSLRASQHHLFKTGNVSTELECGLLGEMKSWRFRTRREALMNHDLGSRLIPPRKHSEAETATDCRSTVIVVVIGDAGTMRNGDGQTAAYPGIRNSDKAVETLGEVMIRIERPLIEGACAGAAEAG